MMGSLRLLPMAVALCFLSASPAIPDSDYEDVVYLKNGEVRRGVIVEHVPGETIKIKTADGNVFLFRLPDIARMTKEQPEAVADHQSDIEGWYTYWALGGASIAHPSDTEAIFAEFAEEAGAERFSFTGDLFGFYRPVIDDRTIAGFVVNFAAENMEVSGPFFTGQIEIVDVSTFTYSLSGMHFLLSEIGRGPFVRADAGVAAVVVEELGLFHDRTDLGTGLLVGTGYGLPVMRGTRVLFNANYSIRFVGGDATRALGWSIAGLF